jgi:hypothetical protein
MKNKNEKSSVYATVSFDDGVNYREIAETMTQIGFKMNHSSARNYVLRVMKKFALAITTEWDMTIPEQKMDKIVKSPQFQQAVCSLLQSSDPRQQIFRKVKMR